MAITTFLPTSVFDLVATKKVGETTTTVEIDSLRIANFVEEGPTKVAKAGALGETKIRFGKTARIEMEDVIGQARALEMFFGATIKTKTNEENKDEIEKVTIGSTFPSEIELVGTAYFIKPETGERITATFTIPHFYPDGLLNLTLEADGDFSVFELSGEIIPNDCGEFYTITLVESAGSCTPGV